MHVYLLRAYHATNLDKVLLGNISMKPIFNHHIEDYAIQNTE